MNKTKRKNEKPGLIKCAAISGVMGVAVTVALLFLVAALQTSGTIPTTLSDEFVIVAAILGAGFGGWRCAKKMGGGVITAGIVAAAAFLIIILIGTLFTAKSVTDAALTLKIIIAALAGGLFGGTLRLYRKTKKSKMRRKI